MKANAGLFQNRTSHQEAAREGSPPLFNKHLVISNEEQKKGVTMTFIQGSCSGVAQVTRLWVTRPRRELSLHTRLRHLAGQTGSAQQLESRRGKECPFGPTNPKQKDTLAAPGTLAPDSRLPL